MNRIIFRFHHCFRYGDISDYRFFPRFFQHSVDIVVGHSLRDENLRRVTGVEDQLATNSILFVEMSLVHMNILSTFNM